MNGLKLSPLIDEKRIAQRVDEMGKEITRLLGKDDLIAVCVLKGSFMFYSDLIRSIDADIRTDFLGCASYGNSMKSSGEVKLTLDLTHGIEGKNVLLVEDIVDTGLTIAHLLDLFRARKPASLKVCALLHKPSRTRVEVPVDYLGFTIEDKFVVGYGLDFAQRYRNLPFIGVVEAS